MSDEVIAEVRRIRHEISRRCDHDMHKVVAYYREFQENLKQSSEYRFVPTTELDSKNIDLQGSGARDPSA